jgi:amidase
VSLAGALDLAPSFDTCGFFARDAVLFGRVADVLLGADAHPDALAAPRLLWPKDLWALLAAEAAAALLPACNRLATRFGAPREAAVAGTSADDGFEAMYWHFRHVQGHEAWSVDGGFITRYAPPLGPGVAERFAWSARVTDAQAAAGHAFRSAYRARLADLLGRDGVLVMPTMPDVAPLLAASESTLEDYRNAAIKLLCVSGLSGFPQVTLPLAQRDGAPFGLSLLGPPGSDRALVALAERIAAPGGEAVIP